MTRRRTAGGGCGKPKASSIGSSSKAWIATRLIARKGGAGEAPLALDCRRRERQRFRDFLRGQPPEELQLDHLALARVQGGQTVQRLVQRERVDLGAPEDLARQRERHPLRFAAALGSRAVARMVGQDAPHHHCRQAHELRAVPPIDALLVDEPEVGLVDERGGLERVVRAFAPHVCAGEPAQLGVDEGKELLVGGPVALAPVDEEPRDVVAGSRAIHSAVLGLGTGPSGENVRDFSTGPGVT